MDAEWTDCGPVEFGRSSVASLPGRQYPAFSVSTRQHPENAEGTLSRDYASLAYRAARSSRTCAPGLVKLAGEQ